MNNALIVYGSTNGNTKNTADIIKKNLKNKGFNVTKKNVSQTELTDLEKDYDLMLFGCSTWSFVDEEGFELQNGFKPFFEKMKEHKFRNSKVGVFGCGDSAYKHYCSAVDMLEDLVIDNSGVLAGSPLKVDGDPFKHNEKIKTWVNSIV